MKYNEKYDLYIDDDLVIYKYDKHLDKLMQRKLYSHSGYLQVNCKIEGKWNLHRVHRIIYETFIGTIPDGYEIDHINTIRNDNRLENLRCVTHKENLNNPITLQAKKGIGHTQTKQTRNKISKNCRGRIWSEFGKKFKEHYGVLMCENLSLYKRERKWYKDHNNRCRWE